MNAESQPTEKKPTITVAGVTFDADQVVTAVVRIDGREVHIQRPEEKPKLSTGFNL